MSPIDPNTLNAVLYALSTLAQTCAALAALIGAIALYRLQSMRDARNAAERTMRRITGVGAAVTLEELLTSADDYITRRRTDYQRLAPPLIECRRFPGRYKRTVVLVLVFGGWNLLMIGAALVGFIHVPWLASHWRWFAGALFSCSVVTVVVTGFALFVMVQTRVGATR